MNPITSEVYALRYIVNEMTKVPIVRKLLFCQAKLSIYSSGLDEASLHEMIFRLTFINMKLSMIASYNDQLRKIYEIGSHDAGDRGYIYTILHECEDEV